MTLASVVNIGNRIVITSPLAGDIILMLSSCWHKRTIDPFLNDVHFLELGNKNTSHVLCKHSNSEWASPAN